MFAACENTADDGNGSSAKNNPNNTYDSINIVKVEARALLSPYSEDFGGEAALTARAVAGGH